MKTKTTKLALALLIAITLGCKKDSNSENNTESKEPSAKEVAEPITAASYFPAKTMVKVFTGGFENGGETHQILKADGKHVHVLVENGGTSMLFIYEVSAEQVKQVYSSGEEYYETEVLKEFTPNRNEIVLAAPFEIGKQWKDEDGIISEITAINHKIETPAGTFETIEVSHKNEDFPTKSYYAKGLGLISISIPEYHGLLLKEIK